MLATNTLFFLFLLAFALRKQRPMEWLSASVAAFALGLLVLLVEPAFLSILAGSDIGLVTKGFSLWFIVMTFLCIQTIWKDLVTAGKRKFTRAPKVAADSLPA